jgi:hypothetical protein
MKAISTSLWVVIIIIIAIIAGVGGYYGGVSTKPSITTTSTVTSTQTITQTLPVPSASPMLVPISNATALVNASSGKPVIVDSGNIIVVIPQGTYVRFPNGSIINVYKFSLIEYSLFNVPPIGNAKPIYGFAFAVDNQVSPQYIFVKSDGTPRPLITIAVNPQAGITSWVWLQYTQASNGSLIGGKYLAQNVWYHSGRYMVNLQFSRPVPWIFLYSPSGGGPVNQYSTQMYKTSYNGSQSALIPVSESTAQINASLGGIVSLGNILAIIPPNTTVTYGSTKLSSYNFSIIDFGLHNLPLTPNGNVPLYAFAYAINGMVSISYTLSNPVITVVFQPENWGSYTWLKYTQLPNGTLVGGSYAFLDTWYLSSEQLNGMPFSPSDVMVNVQFFKPVPWVFFSGAEVLTTSTMGSSSTSTSSSPSGGYY